MLSLSAFQASSESYSYPLSGAEQVEKNEAQNILALTRGLTASQWPGPDGKPRLLTLDLDLPLSILFLDSKTIFEDSSLAESKWKDVYTRALIFLLQREALICSYVLSKWCCSEWKKHSEGSGQSDPSWVGMVLVVCLKFLTVKRLLEPDMVMCVDTQQTLLT